MLNITKDEAHILLDTLLTSYFRTKGRLKLINKILSAYPELNIVKDRYDVQVAKFNAKSLKNPTK